MPYSVVGGPALGFDLARLTGGDQVAGVLRAALAAGTDELDRIAARHPGPVARDGWRRACDAAAAGATPLADVLPLAGAAVEEAAAGETTLLRRLETSLLGDVHALDRLIRGELLDWTWLHSGPMSVQDPVASAAADVLVDAAVSGYLRDVLPDGVRRAMAAPFLRAGLRGHDGAGPAEGLGEVLETLGQADAAVRARWRRVVDELRVHTAGWAPAMHQATWALSLSERLRIACDAQLAGVVAFHRGGFTARDAAYGVWNAVAGVIQASAVLDLLPVAEAETLLRPWRAVYGPGSV